MHHASFRQPYTVDQHWGQSCASENAREAGTWNICRPIFPASKSHCHGGICLEQDRDTYCSMPVSLQVLLLFEDLAFLVFERGASGENFKESYTKRPNVGFSGVMRESASTLRGKILNEGFR